MMFFNIKINEAINFSTEAHNGQRRKISGTPYVIHPLAVGLILARVGVREEVIIGAILHDVLEDSKMDRLEEKIAEKFGEEVLNLIKDVTEKDKKLPWSERKQLAIDHIPKMGKESLLLKSADVLHNMTDLFFQFQDKGEKVYEFFNASKEKQIERYGKIVSKLGQVWSENPLLPDLKQVLKFFK